MKLKQEVMSGKEEEEKTKKDEVLLICEGKKTIIKNRVTFIGNEG